MDCKEDAEEKEGNTNDEGITPCLAAIAPYPGASIDVKKLIAPMHKQVSFSPHLFTLTS